MLEVAATVAGVVVVAVLTVWYLRLRQRDIIGALLDKRRGTSKLVTRADFVEGAEQIPVALALTEDTFYYENLDMEASFELGRIDEVEYDDELVTGRTIDDACRVMRMRSHGAAFEFVLDKADCAKWMAALPAKTFGNVATTAHAV
ncbi:MAG TPA: hypothetical protein VEK57_10595 [Thermoanaerobaculia bacterium]|nr:hypothetical protein [Thermoanaerobaculia bacterium]